MSGKKNGTSGKMVKYFKQEWFSHITSSRRQEIARTSPKLQTTK
jgi:hypothetical protein